MRHSVRMVKVVNRAIKCTMSMTGLTEIGVQGHTCCVCLCVNCVCVFVWDVAYNALSNMCV